MFVPLDKVIKALDFWSSYFTKKFRGLDSDDLKQEAFLGKVQHITNESYIYTVIKCDMLDYIRKEFRKNTRFINYAPETLPEKIVDDNNIIFLIDHLNQVINDSELDERQKKLLFLLYYKNATMNDVGMVLNLSISSISALHQQTLDKIRSTINDSNDRNI